jgi:hypothetical protein
MSEEMNTTNPVEGTSNVNETVNPETSTPAAEAGNNEKKEHWTAAFDFSLLKEKQKAEFDDTKKPKIMIKKLNTSIGFSFAAYKIHQHISCLQKLYNEKGKEYSETTNEAFKVQLKDSIEKLKEQIKAMINVRKDFLDSYEAYTKAHSTKNFDFENLDKFIDDPDADGIDAIINESKAK